jgi:hypothetical protein
MQTFNTVLGEALFDASASNALASAAATDLKNQNFIKLKEYCNAKKLRSSAIELSELRRVFYIKSFPAVLAVFCKGFKREFPNDFQNISSAGIVRDVVAVTCFDTHVFQELCGTDNNKINKFVASVFPDLNSGDVSTLTSIFSSGNLAKLVEERKAVHDTGWIRPEDLQLAFSNDICWPNVSKTGTNVFHGSLAGLNGNQFLALLTGNYLSFIN